MAKAPDERFASINELVEALTGQPVAIGRAGASIPPPDIGFAAGSRAPNTGKEAFAQTMGSGDHGPAAPMPPTQHAAMPPPAQDLGTAGTVSAHPPPAKRRTMLIALCVIAGAAIAAVTLYMVMRDRSTPKAIAKTPEIARTPEIETPRPAPPPPPPPPATAPATPTSDTPTPTSDKPTAETKPRPQTKPKPPAAPAAIDDEADDGDEVVAKKLKDAQAALDDSKWDRAEALANTVSTSEDATPRQRARATLIYGMLQCMVRNDESRARAQLRKLAGAPKLRKKLLDACHAANYLQDVRR
jgi:hypothetical protein